MISTQKIKKALLKHSKARKKKGPEINLDQSYYIGKIAQYNINGLIEPTDIFIKLIDDCISSLDLDDSSKFDYLLIQLIRDTQHNGNKNFILSLTALLNKHLAETANENLILLLSGFFSVYEIHQIHLSEPVKMKLKLTNFLDHYLNTQVFGASDQQTHSKTDRFRVLPSHQQQLLIKLATKGLLTNLPQDFIKSLCSKMSDENASLLASLSKLLPSKLMKAVIERIISMTKSKRRDSIYQACILIKAYFPFMEEKNQKLVIQYLKKIVSRKNNLPSSEDNTYDNMALKVLDKILVHINQGHYGDIISMLSEPLNRQLYFYRIGTNQKIFYPARILLKLRNLCPTNDAVKISLLIKNFIINHNDSALILLTSEWKRLTAKEQKKLAELIISKLRNDNQESTITALKMLANIDDLSNIENQQEELLTCLSLCISSPDKEENSAALSALSNLTSLIPKHWKFKFLNQTIGLYNANMRYVTYIYKNNHPTYTNTYNLFREIDKEKATRAPTVDNFGFELFIMAKLSLSFPERAASLVGHLMSVFDLFEETTLDLIGFRSNLQYWIMKSVVLLGEYIPKKEYRTFAKDFIKEVKLTSNQNKIFILADLIETMPKKLKITTVTELAQTVLLKDENTLKLILPYVENLPFNFKIYMLNYLTHSRSKDKNLGELFSALCASCRNDIIKHDLEHVRVNQHILPNELIDYIFQFTHC